MTINYPLLWGAEADVEVNPGVPNLQQCIYTPLISVGVAIYAKAAPLRGVCVLYLRRRSHGEGGVVSS